MLNIICSSPAKKLDLSIAGIQILEPDPFDGECHDEPCDLTFEDIADYVDADDRDEEDKRPDAGGVPRLSESNHWRFWTYFNRFVRFWPWKTFNVKHGYERGFVEMKKRRTGVPQPLFEEYAVEVTERHLNAWMWAERKGYENKRDPIWFALHMPKATTVDLIDVDAKQYGIGYYREGGDDKGRLMPVIHIPLEHFKTLMRVYDAFPGRIWCISSETLGIHAWKKHDTPQPSLLLHKLNKRRLADIGLPTTEAHPMPGRCLRRPFGDGYRTVTPDGVLTEWTDQLDYFENDGRTPSFNRLCRELVTVMYRQWQAWKRFGDANRNVDVRPILEKCLQELQEIGNWLKSGCPLEPVAPIPIQEPLDTTAATRREILEEILGERPPETPHPTLRIMQAIFLVSSGENTDADIALILEEAQAELSTLGSYSAQQPQPSKAGPQRCELASMRGGNWAKELLRLARGGLVHEDSVGTVVHEMAKWLWWIELHSLPKEKRLKEIARLLTVFVLKKHNNCVSRLLNGQEKEVLAQVSRCVKKAAEITEPKSVKGFAETRQKWLNGGYRFPIRLVPALTGQEEVSLSPSRQFTVMCINFEPLPEVVQTRIKMAAGRNKVMHFATGLVNWLYDNNGKAHVGRQALIKMLGYKNANQIAKYVGIMIKAGIITKGGSYKVGRNAKCYYVNKDVMRAMHDARNTGRST